MVLIKAETYRNIKYHGIILNVGVFDSFLSSVFYFCIKLSHLKVQMLINVKDPVGIII
jgi:hypothetical protein